MQRLTIKCLKTEKLILTGISMDKAIFENRAIPLNKNTVHRPACGQNHTWSTPEAFLQDDKPLVDFFIEDGITF